MYLRGPGSALLILYCLGGVSWAIAQKRKEEEGSWETGLEPGLGLLPTTLWTSPDCYWEPHFPTSPPLPTPQGVWQDRVR